MEAGPTSTIGYLNQWFAHIPYHSPSTPRSNPVPPDPPLPLATPTIGPRSKPVPLFISSTPSTSTIGLLFDFSTPLSGSF